MHGETIDELRAFELASEAARKREWPWRPPYWIELEDGKWEVGAASEPLEIILIDGESGEVLFNEPPLDPLRAFAIAREYARSHSLKWLPCFNLTLEDGAWRVESCGSQMGGNVYIHVRHDGVVIKHWFNPK
jgi:hypothetical protein